MIGNALKLIEFLYIQDKDKLYEVKEYKKKRNNNQNSRYWKLINELSLKTKISVEELHVCKWFFNVDVLTCLHCPCRCEAVPMVACSHDYRVNIFVVQKLTTVGKRLLNVVVFRFCRVDSRGIRIAQSDNIYVRKRFKTAKEFVSATAATD